MSSGGSSPSTSSSLQDDKITNKPLRIRFIMKCREVKPSTEELVRTKETSVDSCSEARDGNIGMILNDEWPSWFPGRRGRKRKPSAPPDSTETPDMTQLGAATSKGNVKTSTTPTTTKDKSIGSPIPEGQTSSTWSVASTHNAAEHEATRGHVLCNNNDGKSVEVNEEPKTHKCKSCPAAFATGQQLGGHMRAHFKGTLTFSASSERGKGKGVAQTGASLGTSRDIAQVGSSSPQSFKDKDFNPSSSTEDPMKDTAAAAFSSRSVTREFFTPLAIDLNQLPPPEGELMASQLELTLSLPSA